MPDLGPGTTVTIRVPPVPTVSVTPPPTSTVRVLPERGPTGPTGPPAGLQYTQATPSAAWSIVHNLGRRPVVTVWVDGQAGLADVEVIDTNTVLITFPAPVTGYASLA